VTGEKLEHVGKSKSKTIGTGENLTQLAVHKFTKRNQSINQSIIWHYNPLWVFAFSVRSVQVVLSLAVSFQFLTFSFFRSSMTSSCHRCLGLPIGLVPIGFQTNSFLVGLAWSIL
jgi:hypothetical protein